MGDRFLLKNWLFVVFLGVSAYIIFDFLNDHKKQSPQQPPPPAISYELLSRLLPAIIEQEKNFFPNPVAERQAFFLKKTVLTCAASRLTEETRSEGFMFLKNLPPKNLDKKDIEKASFFLKKYHQECVNNLLDQSLGSGAFSLLLARSLNSLDLTLGPEYSNLPHTWPEEMLQSSNASQLSKLTGTY